MWGKVELYHGKIEGIIDKAANNAGLTRTQFKRWQKAGNIDTRTFPRGGRKSKRRKEREEARDQHYQQQWEEHDGRLKRTEEE